MEQQIEYRLARARSAVGQKYAGRGVEIPDVALPILRAVRRLHPDKQFTLEANGCEGNILPIDAVDFAEVLAVLLDNAGKWARTHVALTFSCDASGGCTTRIVDDGPGIPDALMKEAFAVGSRFDPEDGRHWPWIGDSQRSVRRNRRRLEAFRWRQRLDRRTATVCRKT